MSITETAPAPETAAFRHLVTPGAVGPHWSGSGESDWLALAADLVPQIAEQADHNDRMGTFVHDSFELLRRHGFMSMLVPAEVGGGGASFAELTGVLATLAHGCPSTSLTLSMHSHLVAAQVWRHRRGMPAPVLARVAAEQIVLVSTGASDWMESNGTAVPVEGGYRVSARKAPASGASVGNVLVTSIRYDSGADGAQVIHAAIPFAAEGVSVEETWDAHGMRATGSHTVVLDDVFVPEAAIALVRPAGVWHPVWATVLGVALPLIMSTYVGVAEAAAAEALALAAPKAERPETAQVAGRMLNRLAAAQDGMRAMIETVDDLRFDNSIGVASTALIRKTNVTEAAIDTVRLALELGGGATFSRSNVIERLQRDVHGALYHPLPTAQQERFTGRAALGLAPF